MKTFIATLALLFALSFAAAAQTEKPNLAGGGVAYNRLNSPTLNFWATGIYNTAVTDPLKARMSSTFDLFPTKRFDAAGKSYWAFTTSFRQGLHYEAFNSGRWSLHLGGAAGAAFAQSPTGTEVSPTGEATITPAYKLTESVYFALPVRTVFINDAWHVIPQVGVLFKLK